MRVTLLLALLSIGCGDGGDGPSPFRPRFDGSTSPAIGGASDRGNGTDRGGGTTSAIGAASEGQLHPPTTCRDRSDCRAGGGCEQRDLGTIGYCIEPCALAPELRVGASPDCAPGWSCVRLGDIQQACLLECTTAADCPALTGLMARCERVSAVGLPLYCTWMTPQP